MKEHVIALPRELDENQRHELVKDWIAQEIGAKHAYQYAIHNPPALDGGEQPHTHIMFSERTRDSIERDPEQYFKRYNSKNPEKGGAKKANTPKKSAERKADLKAMRDRWEKTCNAHLERAGRKERINMKSLKEQGLNRKPIDLSMSQLKDPTIKGAYQVMLDSKNDFISLRRQTIKFMNPSNELVEQEKQAAISQLKIEAQQQALEHEKSQEIKKQSEVTAVTEPKTRQAPLKEEQERPKTIKEYVLSLNREQRQKEKELTNRIMSQYKADINNKAIELYEQATPLHQRAKPLFAHYSYSDMKEVQAYKTQAERELYSKDPSRHKEYSSAVDFSNTLNEIERSESYQRRADRTREHRQDKGKDQDIER